MDIGPIHLQGGAIDGCGGGVVDGCVCPADVADGVGDLCPCLDCPELEHVVGHFVPLAVAVQHFVDIPVICGEGVFVHVHGSKYSQKILYEWDLNINSFIQVCPIEMLDKLEHPITNKISEKKAS